MSVLQQRQWAEAFFWSDLELDRQHILLCESEDGQIADSVRAKIQALALTNRITVVAETDGASAATPSPSAAPGVERVVAPLHRLAPIPSSSVDLVIIAQVLGRGSMRMLRILRELQRVLRPGGRLLIRQELPDRELAWWRRHDRLLRLSEYLADETVEAPVELDELLLGLELVGFQAVRSGQFIADPIDAQQWYRTLHTISRRGARMASPRWRALVGEELKELHELFSDQVIRGSPFFIVHAKK